MICAIQTEPGKLDLAFPSVINETTCPYVVSLYGSWDMSSLGITPSSVAYVFAWGVASVIGLWVIGIALRAVLGVIGKA